MKGRVTTVGLFVFLAGVFAVGSYGGEVKVDLPAMGGSAVSPDGSVLVVSLTAKTELVFFDTSSGKETKRVKVEFQPTQVAWGDKVLFVAQKGSGVVHILDADSGKELKTANAGGPVRNLAVVKGVCFASDDNRGVFAIDAAGTASKTEVGGTFIAADPKGGFVCTVIDGKARTDVFKHSVEGKTLKQVAVLPGAVGASLQNVKGVQVSGDGKLVGVVAGGGWAGPDRKRHYGVPLYSTEDMKTQVGDLETGPFPGGCAFHPVLPLAVACTGKKATVFNAKSQAPGQTFDASLDGDPTVLAFVAKGRKLAWGTSDAGKGTGKLTFYDLDLTKEQQEELDKAYGGK